MARMLKCKKCGEEIQAGTQGNHYRLKHPEIVGKSPASKSRNKKLKRSVALARRNGRNGHEVVHHPEQEVDDVFFSSRPLTFALGYATGRTQAQLEAYAGSIGVPASDLTHRVAKLLRSQARGPVLGTKDTLP